MCSNPTRPALMVGGMQSNSHFGWKSTSDTWSDYTTIPIIVPAFASYLQVGLTVTGVGEIRIKGTKQTDATLIEVSTGTETHEITGALTYWTDPPGPTAADTNHAILTHSNSSSGDGYKVNTLQDLQIAMRTTDTDWDLTVHAVKIMSWSAADGADLTEYDTSDGGLNP